MNMRIGTQDSNVVHFQQGSAKDLAAVSNDASTPKDVEFHLLAQAHAQTLGKPAEAVKLLQQPDPLTLAPTTMEHLGSLGSNQISADIAGVMLLFQKLAQQMRDTARTQRTSDMQSQVTALQGAASKMKDAALSRFTAAVVQGAIQIASGAVQIGMSTYAAKQSIKGLKQDTAGKDMLDQARKGGKTMGEPQKVELRTAGKELKFQGAVSKATGEKFQSISQGLASMSTGLGSMIGAGITLQADLADAQRAELDVLAKVSETGVQHGNDTMQQMLDVIRDVKDKVQSIQQSAIETNRTISRNI